VIFQKKKKVPTIKQFEWLSICEFKGSFAISAGRDQNSFGRTFILHGSIQIPYCAHAILTFLTSMMAEFLIWTQVVNYWTADVGFTLKKATNTYAIIGLIGIV
jgi:hypothetical protein